MLERLGDELRGDLGEELHEHLTRREVRDDAAAGRRAAAHRAAPRAQRRVARAALAALLRRASAATTRGVVAGATMPACRIAAACRILLLDLPPEHHAAGSAFWAGATGRTAAPDPPTATGRRSGPSPTGGTSRSSARAGTPPRWHVDIETDDIAAEVARLEALGATRHRDMGSFWQLLDPAGLVFCVVGIQTGEEFERYAVTWA